MFAIHLRHIYRTCDRIIVRNLRSQRLESKTPNPGLDRRLRAFQKDGLRVKDTEAEQFVEHSESDFYNVGEAYNEHLNETLIGKYELRHQIVKEKYFKENMPNLLTWSEKEQIRHLASTDPDEWTPEKIAESFPITVPVIKKLLKYPWKPATEDRIARHDASVMRNWRELKDGSLDIPPDLRQHFLKFSNRTIPPLKKESIKIDITREKEMGEFEKIVRRCAPKEDKNTNATDNESQLTLPDTKDYVDEVVSKHNKKDKKLMTLNELTDRIKTRLQKSGNVDINDQMIVDSVSTQKDHNKDHTVTLSQVNHNEIEINYDRNDDNKLVEYKKSTDNPAEIMDYPERIRIPKKAYKKGATYKVNDCFYDHDGKFLYRVLGLTNSA